MMSGTSKFEGPASWEKRCGRSIIEGVCKDGTSDGL